MQPAGVSKSLTRSVGPSYMNLLTTMIVRVRPMIWVPGQLLIF